VNCTALPAATKLLPDPLAFLRRHLPPPPEVVVDALALLGRELPPALQVCLDAGAFVRGQELKAPQRLPRGMKAPSCGGAPKSSRFAGSLHSP
jgi:hypothetical protein